MSRVATNRYVAVINPASKGAVENKPEGCKFRLREVTRGSLMDRGIQSQSL